MQAISLPKTDDVSFQPAAEMNSMFNELQNAITDAGLTLSGSDLHQIAKAMAIYAAVSDYYVDTGSVNAYQVNPQSPLKAPPAYYDGMKIRFVPANSNTGASTINVGSIGVVNIVRENGDPLQAFDLEAGFITEGYYYSGAVRIPVDQMDIPAGTIWKFDGYSAPFGWVFADGSALSRTTYAELFNNTTFVKAASTTSGSPIVTALSDTSNMFAGMAVTGTGIPSSTTIASVDSGTQVTLSANATATGSPSIRFYPNGAGDGSTTFNVLDARGKALVGAGQGSGLTKRILGKSGGEEAHTMTLSELVPHIHNTLDGGSAGTGGYMEALNDRPDGSTKSAGSGTAFNVMQPFVVVNVIIKT